MHVRQSEDTIPRPGELWLSCPPWTMIARVTDVHPGAAGGPPVVLYSLLDEDGSVLDSCAAELDASWWTAFQPMLRRFG